MANIEPLKAMRIGVDEVVWAPLKTDDGTAPPTYETKTVRSASVPVIYPLPGVMVMNINPNSSIETAFYDDGPGEVASTVGNIEVTFNKSALNKQDKQILLGKAVNTYGMVFHTKQDISPWGALGFRTLRSDGTYRYVWLLKGRFSEPADNNETKGESINFQSDEIVGRFVKVNHEYTIGTGDTAKKVKPWKTEIEGVDAGGQVLNTSWYGSVVLPDAKILPAFTTSTDYIVVQKKDLSEVVIYEVTATGDKNEAVWVDSKITLAKAKVTKTHTYKNGKWQPPSTTAPAADVELESDTVVTIYNSKLIEAKQGGTVKRTYSVNPMPGKR